jgi:hypothetical protein
MDPDMNKYDLNHVTTGHAMMSPEDWQRAYKLAWSTYYTPDHMETVMRRAVAKGISPGRMMLLLVWFDSCIKLEGLHPLEGGYFRLKFRRDRRSSARAYWRSIRSTGLKRCGSTCGSRR